MRDLTRNVINKRVPASTEVLAEFAHGINKQTDLVCLVGEKVNLKKRGSAYIGLCPFHGERTPSFQVVPARHFWHCFGCGKSGNAITWIQETQNADFNTALNILCKRMSPPDDGFRLSDHWQRIKSVDSEKN